MRKVIDSHLHLDKYLDNEILMMMKTLDQVDMLISVSYDLESCKRNSTLSKSYQNVKTAFGFHPEQAIITDEEMADLFQWVYSHIDEMIAVGEVGLPYYLRTSSSWSSSLEPYKELLEEWVKLASKNNLPISLHAVYDDVPTVCSILEKHSIEKAHFHWFKGVDTDMDRIIRNGHFISLTPDILYEEEIQVIAKRFPISQMMVETDGPWPFEGPFSGRITHPNMIHQTVRQLSELKTISIDKTYETLYVNTRNFFDI
ncbi:TatD family hydrolase [Robertmurraya korlensis]|uniref:TatD family hydrolase n=1 Tax=Robertmurraya korlensis TaxID=519977 RepID=UPI0008270360|nr:TatD family hydrolase [Robertmurraya korlensis]